MEHMHTLRDGTKVSLRKMTDEHLRNTIRWIERKAREGTTIATGNGPDDADFDHLYGGEVLDHFGYEHYVKEFQRRGGETPAKAVDRLLGMADQFLDDWESEERDGGDEDELQEAITRFQEWQKWRPIIVAAVEAQCIGNLFPTDE